MLLFKKIIGQSNVSIIQMREYSADLIEDVKKKFADYQSNGIIINCDFNSNTWYLTNEQNVTSFVFDFNEVLFNAESKARNLGNYIDLISAVKIFIITKIDNVTIRTNYNYLQTLKKLFNETNYLNKNSIDILKRKFVSDSHYRDFISNLIDFISFYSLDIDIEYTGLLYNQLGALSSWQDEDEDNNQRDLPTLESMFKFGDILDLFWTESSYDEKEEYFPIKLWWEITTRIPLRVTEFILTPYDCTNNINQKYYLGVRRSSLKGSNIKKVTHKIDTDYRIQDIRIDKDLFDLIQEYKNMVDRYDSITDFYGEWHKNAPKDVLQRKFIFSYRAYFKSLDNKFSPTSPTNYDFFCYYNLSLLLSKFYRRKVSKYYNIIDKQHNPGYNLLENEIEKISLMDTRHYAFINLILNDIEPFIIKKISGHNSFNSSYHYYDHVEIFVRCYTYSMAKKIARNKKTNHKTHTIKLNNSSNLTYADVKFQEIFGEKQPKFKIIGGGKCFSEKAFEDDYIDCKLVDNDCAICNFFYPNDNSKENISQRIKENEQQLKMEIDAIKYLIKQHKQVQNLREEYGLRINKIKSFANQNAKLISDYIL